MVHGNGTRFPRETVNSDLPNKVPNPRPYKWYSDSAFKLAEREGFEPPEPLRAHLISSQAHSTTLPPLRGGHLAAES